MTRGHRALLRQRPASCGVPLRRTPSWGAPDSAFPANETVIPIDNGTDTDTLSSYGAEEFDDTDVQGMTPAEVDEHLFWAYQRSKSRWRRHMHKPTRRVRRFLKRRGKGKGKGRGKGGKGFGRGQSWFSFMTEMTDDEIDEVFFGRKG